VVREGELAVQGVAGHELVAALAAAQVRGVRAGGHLKGNKCLSIIERIIRHKERFHRISSGSVIIKKNIMDHRLII